MEGTQKQVYNEMPKKGSFRVFVEAFSLQFEVSLIFVALFAVLLFSSKLLKTINCYFELFK